MGTFQDHKGACVHHLFEAQVKKTPHAIALIDRGERLTYQALNQRANKLAHVLLSSGVAPEILVGVFIERSADLIVALLAILKAGGAYVPIDPNYPRERVELICQDAGLPLVLTQESLAARLAGIPARCICLDHLQSFAHLAATDPGVEMTPENAIYVLYTSGSTGQPKGVLSPHRAITSRVIWAQETYPYEEGEVACARTTLGFVDSVAEIFAPLALGAPLVLIRGEAQRDPVLMIQELAAEGVTRIVLVPSLLSTLFALYPDLGERLPRLRYWFLGGEPVPVALVETFRRLMPGRKLINIYGATEVSGDATYFDFDEMPSGLANSPIGAALRGVYARVLDEHLHELPEMAVGEVCISGVCLARGYLNRPEAASSRFVSNPFPEGGRLYKTGDLGRRLSSGAIEYLGRSDQLLKIRGMRVEPGEVELHLSSAEGVSQAVVVAQRDQGGQNTLVAFYTAKEGHSISADHLRSHLQSRLPEYMVPSLFVALDAFPINANGKVDRRALCDWSAKAPGEVFQDPPANDEERRVAGIWQSILGCGPVGRSQSFFALGGSSLDAIRIAAALGDRLGQRVPVSAIFQHPTVARLAAFLSSPRGSTSPAALARASITVSGRPIPPVLPLSHYQFPFWFFYALTGDISVVSEVFGFSSEPDVERLQEAYSRTVASFDVLWMRFPRFKPEQRLGSGALEQTLGPRRPSRFLVSDHRESEAPDRDILQKEADRNSSAPFAPGRVCEPPTEPGGANLGQPTRHNEESYRAVWRRIVTTWMAQIRPDRRPSGARRHALEEPPHVHARLVMLRSGDHRLMVTIPHVAVDMSSMELFRQTLEQNYLRGTDTREAPRQATATLGDLVEWERRGDQREEIEEDTLYWTRLSPGPALNKMPGRLFTNKLSGRRARAFSARELPGDLLGRVQEYAQRRALSFPIVLISALCDSLRRATGADDLRLLLMLEKRDRAETRGLFTNLASLMSFRLKGCLDATLDELVRRTGEQLMASYDHSDFLMRRPALFNNFWADAPRPLLWLVRQLSRRIAALWPEAKLDEELLAQYVFAILPYPQNILKTLTRWALGKRPAQRDILVALNIMPEVYQPEPSGAEGFRVVRKRGVELILRQGDLIIGSDPLLDRSLQVHVSRNEGGPVVVNLYGGGIDQEGLDEINSGVLRALHELAPGESVARGASARP